MYACLFARVSLIVCLNVPLLVDWLVVCLFGWPLYCLIVVWRVHVSVCVFVWFTFVMSTRCCECVELFLFGDTHTVVHVCNFVCLFKQCCMGVDFVLMF